MMNQDFNKRGVTDEDIKKYEEEQKEIYLQNKQTEKFRITSGGSFEDFDDLEEAIKYLRKRLSKYTYASINAVYPAYFQIKNG
ncbi:hypothetical protein LCGC14_1374820 [marine sediment metagenome]|uniref:Uncharacterized protein n=1 Tax=marine sediment metagenome TaxID=412755 RepID=A0A0F9K4R7_9ZZZZ